MNRKMNMRWLREQPAGSYELAKQFASNRYDLVMVARNHDELKTRADEFKSFGINVITIAKNLLLKKTPILCILN